MSSVSAQRKLPQLCENAPGPCAFTNVKNLVKNGRMRESPVNSPCERMACSIGMCGQKSGPLFSDVRSDDGPKKPSPAWVARTPLIHFVVSDCTRESPIT